MRLNKYIALHTAHSRRSADKLISENRVTLNGHIVTPGQEVDSKDIVAIDNEKITTTQQLVTIIFNKPRGYVCSRDGQGSKTIYDVLPQEFSHLNSVGRLDKDSSGLLLLTNDGEMANQLTHPRYAKTKVYEVKLDKHLQPLHQQMISNTGITLDDGPSKLEIEKLDDTGKNLQITMREGRNRQIRRTFEELGYRVLKLHRIVFGEYSLDTLPEGKIKTVSA